MGIHLKRLDKALLMNTYNIRFGGEIRKILILFGWIYDIIWGYENSKQTMTYSTYVTKQQ